MDESRKRLSAWLLSTYINIYQKRVTPSQNKSGHFSLCCFIPNSQKEAMSPKCCTYGSYRLREAHLGSLVIAQSVLSVWSVSIFLDIWRLPMLKVQFLPHLCCKLSPSYSSPLGCFSDSCFLSVGEKDSRSGKEGKRSFSKEDHYVICQAGSLFWSKPNSSTILVGVADLDFSLNRSTTCQVNWRVLVDWTMNGYGLGNDKEHSESPSPVVMGTDRTSKVVTQQEGLRESHW